MEENTPLRVYAAFRSSPDYNAPGPSLKSIHLTLDGAKRALYPDREDFRNAFRQRPDKEEWDGPDGFGLIRVIELLP